MGIARGTADNKVPIVAGTVKEALDGEGDGITSLLKTLNENQQTLKTQGSVEIPNVYKVRFIGDTSLIQNASLVSKADPDRKNNQ